MNKHLTVDQLETMKIHELADLLGNIVLVLRRMPDVECRQLATQFPAEEPLLQPKSSSQPTLPADSTLDLKEAELKNKKVTDLKAIALDLGLRLPAKIKKDDLIAKILARSGQGHSEQYAIQNL